MERRNLREGGLPFSMQELSLSPDAKQQLQDKINTSKTDSDEEFFDCDDDKVDDESKCKVLCNLKLFILKFDFLIFVLQQVLKTLHGVQLEDYQS